MKFVFKTYEILKAVIFTRIDYISISAEPFLTIFAAFERGERGLSNGRIARKLRPCKGGDRSQPQFARLARPARSAGRPYGRWELRAARWAKLDLRWLGCGQMGELAWLAGRFNLTWLAVQAAEAAVATCNGPGARRGRLPPPPVL